MSTQIQTNFKRYEKKFFLTREQYRLFLKKIDSFVKADAFPHYTICNLYYDTDNFALIRASIEKPVYKEKMRVRSYGTPTESDKVFVELKKKYEGVVYKRRVTTPPAFVEPLLSGFRRGDENPQISKELAYFNRFYRLQPKAFIAYDRQAFQGIENKELRITFDTKLRYRLENLDLRNGDYGEPILNDDEDKILMEIKIPGTCPLWLSRILSELKIHSSSFSKYGTCYKEHILKNNTKLFAKEMRYSA